MVQQMTINTVHMRSTPTTGVCHEQLPRAVAVVRDQLSTLVSEDSLDFENLILLCICMPQLLKVCSKCLHRCQVLLSKVGLSCCTCLQQTTDLLGVRGNKISTFLQPSATYLQLDQFASSVVPASRASYLVSSSQLGAQVSTIKHAAVGIEQTNKLCLGLTCRSALSTFSSSSLYAATKSTNCLLIAPTNVSTSAA